MRTFKTRHQLFLPEDLARRLAALARSSGRARSEILVEALEAWFTRRASPPSDEAVLIRLARVDQTMGRLSRSHELLWEAMSRLIRHQLVTAASLPAPDAAAQAHGAKLHQAFLDEITKRRAKDEPIVANDQASKGSSNELPQRR